MGPRFVFTKSSSSDGKHYRYDRSAPKRVGAEVDFDDERAWRTRPLFHSTSHVAAGPLRTRVAAHGAEAAVDRYAGVLFAALRAGSARRLLTLRRASDRVAALTSPIEGDGWTPGRTETRVAFGTVQLDGRALHVAQLPALFDDLSPGFAELDPAARDANLKPVREALGTLLGQLELSPDDVPTYYATLLADGDAMGKMLDRIGTTKGLEGHKQVSAALDAFSRRCRDIVEAHAGSLVYSGGDDVLALLPLHTALACARALHDVFGTTVGDALDALGDAGARPTLSVGLGIGHHLDDMADVRALAKRAEKSAKAFSGKDALAIVVQMRSGGTLEVVGGFASSLPLDGRVVSWAKLLLEEALPDKAAYDLEAAMAPLLHGEASAELSDVARSLATRVLDRKRGERGAEPLSEKIRSLVDDYLLGGDVAVRVHGLARELQIARLVSESIRVAFQAPRKQGAL